MKNLLLLPLLLCTAALSAQTLNAGVALTNLNDSVHVLTQNALRTLIGMIALVAVAWLAWMLKSCADLNKKTGNTRMNSPFLGLIALVFCAFLGSCSVEQRTRAEQYRAAQGYENRTCPMNRHDPDQSNVGINHRHGYVHPYGPVFCKRCGQRLFNTQH